jgi:DNA-binding GntR family transcriptional regulator
MSERIKHKSLAEHIVQELEAKIIDETLTPGQRIIEETLCKTFKVSHSPVREALQILESRGFVVREPRRGFTVVRITLQEVEHIYRIRASIEGLAMSLAVRYRTPKLLDKLTRMHEKMILVAEKGNDKVYQGLNHKFHEIIVSACGNPRLIQLIRTFDRQTARYRVAVMIGPGWMENSTHIHKAIIAAFETGDAEAAERIRRGVVLSQIKRFSEIFSTEGEKNGRELTK